MNLVSWDRVFALNYERIRRVKRIFMKWTKSKKRYALYTIVQAYHITYKKPLFLVRREEALYELKLRVLFEALKGIIRVSSRQKFYDDIYFSPRRERNHHTRLCILQHIVSGY